MTEYKIYIYNIIFHYKSLFQNNGSTIIYLDLRLSIQNFIGFLYGIIQYMKKKLYGIIIVSRVLKFMFHSKFFGG